MKTRGKRIDREGLMLFIFALPFLLFVLAFAYVPLFGWYMAFAKYKPGIPILESPFSGLYYFRVMLQERTAMLRVLRNTLAMSALNILCSILPVTFAILLSELPFPRFKRVVQTITTLPNFVSWVIVYALTFVIFSSDGLWNTFFTHIGWLSKPTNVMGNANVVWYFQTALSVWKTLGWSAIIYLAAISGLDPELFDAASIDGAGRIRRIAHVTVPGIMPTFVVLLLLSISNLLSVGFDQYLVFYNPLVASKIEVIDYYVYRMGLITKDYSFATAVGLMKSLVSIILLFSINSIAKKIRGESII